MDKRNCISDSDLGRLCEGDLPVEQKLAMQEHIHACPDCKARWDEVCAGSRYVEDMLFKAAAESGAQQECLSDEQLRAFVEQTMSQADRQKAQEHLAGCSRCSDALVHRFTQAYEQEGDSWWSEYVAEQLLGLFKRLSDKEIDEVACELNAGTVSGSPTETIKLPAFEPAEKKAQRLAADTGEGFASQKLYQYEPPFEFEFSQFGEQLTITAQLQETTAAYQNCLARLELLEQEKPCFSRTILIQQGRGRCIIQPDEIKGLQLEKTDISLRLSPLITAEQLDEAGSEAYTAILSNLSQHDSPEIRCGAVEVIARICGLQARSLIEPVAQKDPDESVRTAAGKALGRIPSPRPEKS